MKTKFVKFSSCSDLDVIGNVFLYFGSLRPILPSQRLKDCAAGVCALLFEFYDFLNSHKEYHGDF